MREDPEEKFVALVMLVAEILVGDELRGDKRVKEIFRARGLLGDLKVEFDRRRAERPALDEQEALALRKEHHEPEPGPKAAVRQETTSDAPEGTKTE